MPLADRTPIPCLILACGNPLREDDGVGPWLAQWARDHFQVEPSVRIVSAQQWTPEMADELAHARTAVFIDCTTVAPPGAVEVVPVQAVKSVGAALATHHLGAAQLLELARSLYGAAPATALLLTIGAASLELREGFSEAVQAALPAATSALENAVRRMLQLPLSADSR